jgi:multiple sugar transport system permease protein/cellobiose transport system permease protein
MRTDMIKIRKIAILILLCGVSVVSLFPFYMMFSMSTYASADIFTGIKLFPGNYFLSNLKTILNSRFGQAYLNSITVSVFATIVSVLVSAMAGYAFKIYTFKFKNIVFQLVVLTMMIPPQISMVGYMIQMRAFHLMNTLIPLMLIWFANGFGVFWMTKYMQSALSIEMVESARMDGANEILVFFRIILPCMLPAITTLLLLVFLWSWNNYLLPLIFITRANLATVPIFIQSLRNAFRTDYGGQLSGLMLATVPIIILFVIGSKSFIKGLTSGAIKG